MLLMIVMGLLLVVGLALTLRWGGTPWRGWLPAPRAGGEPYGPVRAGTVLAPRAVTQVYVRGVAVALVAGFWVGVLVTGPGVRLIMRLLAVTGPDSSRGRLTEAGEVVGDIELDGTVSLVVFAGVLPGWLSAAAYVLLRRWLPTGRAGGVVFGLLHLVLAATRVEPLRPDNPDFDLVGPGWLSVLAFGLAAVVHGMAVAAVANRFSQAFPGSWQRRGGRFRCLLLVVPPVLVLVPGAVLLLPVVAGLAVCLAVSRLQAGPRLLRSNGLGLAVRGVVLVAAASLLPGTVLDLRDVLSRG